jgi:penicillin-binding protein 2
MLAEVPEGPQKPPLPGLLFRIVVVLAFFILGAQLWRLQVVEGSSYREKADNNRIRKAIIPPSRGIIYDRNGLIVAANAPIFVVSVVPADLPKGRETPVYLRLQELVDADAYALQESVNEARAEGDVFTPIRVKTNVSRVVVMRIEERHLELPGVIVTVDSRREYSQGPLLSHLLGFTAYLSPGLLGEERFQKRIAEGYTVHDQIGSSGLEEQYQDELRGKPGRRIYEVEAGGREVGELQRENPESGHNLVLTIDSELQRDATAILQAGLKPDSSGVAIMTDPTTGEILAIVSLPTFDNNVFVMEERDDEKVPLLQDERQPLFPRATAGLYPPGSTFKLITAAGALQEGVVTRDTVIESKGAIYVSDDNYPDYQRRFPDWAVLGKLNLIAAIANSSNVYMYYLGGGYEPEGFVGLGNERLAHYARMFGYGSPSGIDLPLEEDGSVPDEQWKLDNVGQPWFKGDTYNMSIGQGFVQATPLQVANMTATIANGGTLFQPRLVKDVTDSEGGVVRSIPPTARHTVEVLPEHLRTLAEGMEAGFTMGTLLKAVRIPDLRVAAKTGTGEYEGPRDENGNLPTHGWFTAFAPADHPQVAVTVFVEKGSGSKDAAPIGAALLRRYFHVPETTETVNAAAPADEAPH